MAKPSPRALPLLCRRTEPGDGGNCRVACLSPQGEFATRPAGAGRREGTGEAGGTAGRVFLVTSLSRDKEVTRPPGRNPANEPPPRAPPPAMAPAPSAETASRQPSPARPTRQHSAHRPLPDRTADQPPGWPTKAQPRQPPRKSPRETRRSRQGRRRIMQRAQVGDHIGPGLVVLDADEIHRPLWHRGVGVLEVVAERGVGPWPLDRLHRR